MSGLRVSRPEPNPATLGGERYRVVTAVVIGFGANRELSQASFSIDSQLQLRGRHGCLLVTEVLQNHRKSVFLGCPELRALVLKSPSYRDRRGQHMRGRAKVAVCHLPYCSPRK